MCQRLVNDEKGKHLRAQDCSLGVFYGHPLTAIAEVGKGGDN